MADLSQLKKKKHPRRLGAPPSVKEAGENLTAPEHAPATQKSSEETRKKRPKRRTGRTEPFATRVSPDFIKRLGLIAARDGLKKVEVLEKALEAYEKERKGK
jgi:hypothetical protein